MSYRHFSIDEREIIALKLAEGESPNHIAKSLGRHPSSVYAEISRNRSDGTYYPAKAQAMADTRRRDSKSPWKMQNPDVAQYVKRKLKIEWSPEQIAGRMKKDHPNESKMRISHATIYRWADDEKRDGGNWHGFFRQSGKKRRKRYGTAERRGRIPNRVDIDERPEVVDEKSRLGDWEGDTVEGTKGSGYLATMVDRKSQYLVLGKSDTKYA
jgi:transposase, IS30 family